jgi:hypothetical protein
MKFTYKELSIICKGQVQNGESFHNYITLSGEVGKVLYRRRGRYVQRYFERSGHWRDWHFFAKSETSPVVLR